MRGCILHKRGKRSNTGKIFGYFAKITSSITSVMTFSLVQLSWKCWQVDIESNKWSLSQVMSVLSRKIIRGEKLSQIWNHHDIYYVWPNFEVSNVKIDRVDNFAPFFGENINCEGPKFEITMIFAMGGQILKFLA